MEMHDVLQTASFPFVQTAIEPDLVAMHQFPHQFAIIGQGVGVEGDQGIGSAIVVQARSHLHVETNSMEIPLMLVLAIVLYFQKMALPVLELFASVFAQAVGGFSRAALDEVLAPGCGDELVGVFVVGSEGYEADGKEDEQDGGESFLGEDETRRKEGKTVHFICEKQKKFAIASQLPLAKRTAMFPRGCELQQHDHKQHHHKVRHNGEDAQP